MSPAVVLCLVAAAPAITTLPPDLTPDLERAEADYGVNTPDAQTCVADTQQTEVPACIFGDSTGSLSVVLLGDSHAWMWLPALDLIGKRAHWKVFLLAKSACPPGYADVYNELTRSVFRECSLWHDYSVSRINETRPHLLVLATAAAKDTHGEYFSTADWAAALAQMLTRISIPNNRKVILGSIPYPVLGNSQIAGPDCLAAHEAKVQACSVLYQTAIGATIAQAEVVAARQAGVRRIDPSSWFCSQVCAAVIGNMNVYVHGGHLSATYARFVSGVLASELQQVIDT